jgi:hypothetical protein
MAVPELLVVDDPDDRGDTSTTRHAATPIPSAARAQRKISGTRITTWPATMTRLSRTSPSSMEANARASPRAKTMTPIMITIAARRNTQSSLS